MIVERIKQKSTARNAEEVVFRWKLGTDKENAVVLDGTYDFLTLSNFFTGFKTSGTNTDVLLNMCHVPHKVKPIIVHMAIKHLYRFTKYKSNVKAYNVYIYDTTSFSYRRLLQKVKHMNATRDLINEPANIATPEYICEVVRKEFQGTSANVRVYSSEEIQTLGLNLVHAVGKASVNTPRFLVIEHRVPGAKKTVCLCGKGVTFDAGGLQIKTGNANSYKMKGDKTGGCIVIGILKYAVEENMKCNVIGVVPLVENIISGNVTHAGDIITSYSGKTVEIMHTDAEGRLILADALSFCEQYKPDYIFDVATLTGWASSLHCDTSAIFFTANHMLHELVEKVGESIGERTWGMPKWLDYMQYCESTVADLKNWDFQVRGCSRGSGYMAAMFLAHFVPAACLHKWIHFDVTNNVDSQSMNANTMSLIIDLISKLACA